MAGRMRAGIGGLLILAATHAALAACGDNVDDLERVATVRGQVAATCDCDGNRRVYINCARQVALDAVAAKQLSSACRRQVVRCAAKSTCGRPGAVACCRTSKDGETHCAIVPDAGACGAPSRGSACQAVTNSCCDACRSTGCVTTSTTTTVTTSPPTTGTIPDISGLYRFVPDGNLPPPCPGFSGPLFDKCLRIYHGFNRVLAGALSCELRSYTGFVSTGVVHFDFDQQSTEVLPCPNDPAVTYDVHVHYSGARGGGGLAVTQSVALTPQTSDPDCPACTVSYPGLLVQTFVPVCGNNRLEGPEECEPYANTTCPGRCRTDCSCAPPTP